MLSMKVEPFDSSQLSAFDVVLSNLNRLPLIDGVPGYLLFYYGLAQSTPGTDTFIPANLQEGQDCAVVPYIALREAVTRTYTVDFSLLISDTPTTFEFVHPDGRAEESEPFTTKGVVHYLPSKVRIGPGVGWHPFVLRSKGSAWAFLTCSITLIDG